MSSSVKRAWHYLIAEPFGWIFLCLFQPRRFRRDVDRDVDLKSTKLQILKVAEYKRHAILMVKLVIPMFIMYFSYFLGTYIIFILFHITFYGNMQLSVLFLVVSFAIGTLSGIVMGVLFGITIGLIASIGFSIIFGIMIISIFSTVLYTTNSIVFGITFGIALGIALSTLFDLLSNTFKVSIISGIILGIVADVAISLGLGITVGIISGFQVNIPFGFNLGTSVGIAFVITSCIGFIIGYYRLPFYVVSAISSIRAYSIIRKDQFSAFKHLKSSSLHWDERVYLPLPFLKRTLLLTVEQDEKRAVEEIVFIIVERPQQAWAARAAALEIIIRDLETRKSLSEIGEAWPYLTELLPLEVRPSGPGWSRLTQYLSSVSTDARRYGRPIGRQEQQKALADISENLRKAYPYAAFRDQKVTVRLRRVIEIWQSTVQQEQEQSSHAPQIVGRIDNPYKPGQALNPQDESFVGRRDLAALISNQLNKGSRRPTFLMNGERRMGKTSTLLQLPYLLGSHYIPVFYNLQEPGIYTNIATFLGTLGNKIFAEMQAKGMQVEPIGPRMLRDEYGQLQDTRSYSIFDKWLGKIEELLEQEDSTLLLNFDEFEKLAEAGEAKHIDLRLLLDWFRNIIQFHPRIALLFSGVHTFTEMGQETGVNWSGAFVNVQALRVSFLKRDEAEKLVTKPTPEYPSEELFGDGVVDKIISDTGCHPFLIQAICSALIDNLNAEQRQRAELHDVDNAIEQVLEGWDGYFGDLWIRTSEEQRLCLKALLTLQCADIMQIQQQCGMEENRARRTLKTLLRRDLIAQDGEIYTIVAPIFREWVARNV